MSGRDGDEDEDALRVLIADDEPLARTRLRDLLEGRAGIRVVGETPSGSATVRAVRRLEPDLLFLDVQMPGMDGFEVLGRLAPDERPVVVFSTAWDEYALEAFEVNAVDYLLKPFADERFEAALRRAVRAVREERRDRDGERLSRLLEGLVPRGGSAAGPYLDRFAVPVGGRWVVAPVDTVDWIEASGDYVTLHVEGGTHLLRETMSSVEEGLDPRAFLRIHRSTIVRTDRVRSVLTGEHGEYSVVLRDGTRLRISRGYRDHALARLGVRR